MLGIPWIPKCFLTLHNRSALLFVHLHNQHYVGKHTEQLRGKTKIEAGLIFSLITD